MDTSVLLLINVKKNPILFYFWAHSEFEELTTQTFENLIDRVDVLFLEFVSKNLDSVEKGENDLNYFSQKLGKSLKGLVFNDKGSYLLSLTKGTNKRYVIERTLAPEFEVNEEDLESSAAFFNSDLDTAMKAKEDYLAKNVEYQTKREKSVAKQILAIPETSLVLFGAGHLDLEKLVKKKRPTEIHFPYADYPISYNVKMWQLFRHEGILDKELYLRDMMSQMARIVFNNNYSDLTNRASELAVYHYASLFTLEQIQDYVNYMLTYSNPPLPKHIFEAYLINNGLPVVSEVLEGIKA